MNINGDDCSSIIISDTRNITLELVLNFLGLTLVK